MNISAIDNIMTKKYSGATRKINSGSTFEIDETQKEEASSGYENGIGIFLAGNTVYSVSYAAVSTPENPIVRIADYEVEVNKVNPNSATKLEMCALLSYLDDTNQTDNKGMSSYSKLCSYADWAQDLGFCSGITNEADVFDKKQDWVEILENMKEIFSKNTETYKQMINCDKIIFAMTKPKR